MLLTNLPKWNAAGILFAALFAVAGSAQAVPIDPDLSIMGSLTYDNEPDPDDGFIFSFSDNATHSGTMTKKVGGADTDTTYANGVPTGANPLSGALTDTGDGFGFNGTAASGNTSVADSEFAIGIDFAMTLENTSATDTFEVTIRTIFGNSVESAGPDAFVDSEYTLELIPPGSEEFFTQLITDTINGNEEDGAATGGFGGALSDSGFELLVLTLNPGDFLTLEGNWTMKGGAFDDDTSDVTSMASLNDFNMFASIDSIRNLTPPDPPDPPGPIPEPATLILFALGMIGLVGSRRRQISR